MNTTRRSFVAKLTTAITACFVPLKAVWGKTSNSTSTLEDYLQSIVTAYKEAGCMKGIDVSVNPYTTQDGKIVYREDGLVKLCFSAHFKQCQRAQVNQLMQRRFMHELVIVAEQPWLEITTDNGVILVAYTLYAHRKDLDPATGHCRLNKLKRRWPWVDPTNGQLMDLNIV